MDQLTITLTVTLIYKRDAVRGMDDFNENQTAVDYLYERLPSFIENEIDNTPEFPATAVVQIV